MTFLNRGDEHMKVLICGKGRNRNYIGKIVNEMEEEGLRIALDKLSNIDGLKYDIKEVSNGTFESLEKGDISANEI